MISAWSFLELNLPSVMKNPTQVPHLEDINLFSPRYRIEVPCSQYLLLLNKRLLLKTPEPTGSHSTPQSPQPPPRPISALTGPVVTPSHCILLSPFIPQTPDQDTVSAIQNHHTNLYTQADPVSAAHSSNQNHNTNAHLMNPFKRTERLGEIFGDVEAEQGDMSNLTNQRAGGMPGDSGDPNNPDDNGDPKHTGGKCLLLNLPQGSGVPQGQSSIASKPLPTYHFDFKLKLMDIPQWDGNTDEIVCWMSKVSRLANKSALIWNLVLSPPTLLLQIHREELDFFTKCGRINCKWLDRMKAKASKAYYREAGHYRKTPSEYCIRKNELLTTVNNLDDLEIIMEVMDTVPANWSTILITQSYKDVVEFQAAICYHEDSLMHLGSMGNLDQTDRWRDPSYQTRRSRSESQKARVNLVGGELPPPRFPKDDSVISRKATPKSKGARPCRHCGSDLHWDNECKHSKKGMRTASACGDAHRQRTSGRTSRWASLSMSWQYCRFLRL